MLISPLPIYCRNAAIAADSASSVTPVGLEREVGAAMSEVRAAAAEAGDRATTAAGRGAGSAMRRGRRRHGGGGGGGVVEPVWRRVLSIVAAMQTVALAASSLFGTAGKIS